VGKLVYRTRTVPKMEKVLAELQEFPASFQYVTMLKPKHCCTGGQPGVLHAHGAGNGKGAGGAARFSRFISICYDAQT